jgi:hypothetical protein
VSSARRSLEGSRDTARFHEEAFSLDAILAEARRAPFHGVLSVGDRPAVLAALAAHKLGFPATHRMRRQPAATSAKRAYVWRRRV